MLLLRHLQRAACGHVQERVAPDGSVGWVECQSLPTREVMRELASQSCRGWWSAVINGLRDGLLIQKASGLQIKLAAATAVGPASQCVRPAAAAMSELFESPARYIAAAFGSVSDRPSGVDNRQIEEEKGRPLGCCLATESSIILPDAAAAMQALRACTSPGRLESAIFCCSCGATNHSA